MEVRKTALVAPFLLALVLPLRSQAAGDGLYKAALPPGYTGIRIFNAGAPIPAAAAKFGERRLPSIPTGESSSYYTMVAGSRQVNCGNKSIMVNLQDGKFYTFVCGGTYEGSLLQDPQPSNSSKTFVIFYNLTQKEPIKLMTSNGKLSVVDDTAKKSMGGREINPVRVEFGVFDKQNQRLFDVGAVALAPEKVYSIFATQVAGEVRAYVHESMLASEL